MTLVTAVLMMWVIEEHHAATWERNKVTAIRLFENCAVEHKVRLAMNNHAPRKRHNVVEALRSTGEVVRGGHNCSASRSLSLKEVHDLLLSRWVNASNRLVKQIKERISRKGSCQEDASSLPAGELTDLATCQVEHVNSLQGICHRVSINAAWAAKWAKGWSAPHHHHLID
jgi:cytochrome c5